MKELGSHLKGSHRLVNCTATYHHKQLPHFSPTLSRPLGTELILQVANFGGTLHSRARLSQCPGRLIFLLVFSTLRSSLTVLPNWVNTATVHTSITGFLPRVVGGSSLGSVRQVPFPCPFVLGHGRRAEEEQRGSWCPPTPPPLVLTEVCVGTPPYPHLSFLPIGGQQAP